jgi:hypothetical protein
MNVETPIAPEIINDEFAGYLTSIASQPEIVTILETGSAEGTGSTAAIVAGCRKNPISQTLFCIEVSKLRFAKLKNLYAEDSDWMFFYNGSSVKLKDFMTVGQIRAFYSEHKTQLNNYPLNQVLEWLTEDIQAATVAKQDLIHQIKGEWRIEHFDMVMLDGSAFTGWAELQAVIGARFICLDDIVDIKNLRSFNHLVNDPAYELLVANPSLRNGYAIFQRK